MPATALNGRSFVTPHISNGALGASELPTRLKIAGWGDNPSTKGPVRITERTLEVLPSNQQREGFTEIALDFEHNTVPGSPEYVRSQEPRPVAAYGIPNVISGDGLYLEDLRWTPEGKRSALNYADLSPAVLQDDDGTVLFVHSTALARNGAVFNLGFYSATPTPKPMNRQELITLFATVLGLDPATPEQDVLSRFTAALKPADPPEAITTLTARLDAIEQRIPKPDQAAQAQPAAQADQSKLTEAITTLTARIDALEAQLKASASAVTDAERATLIKRFAVEGKVPLDESGKPYAADALQKLDLPLLRLLVANTPSTVPLHARSTVANPKPDLKGRDRVAAHINTYLTK